MAVAVKSILEKMGASFAEDGTASLSLVEFELTSIFGEMLDGEGFVSVFSDEAFAFTAPAEMVAIGPLWVAGLESPKQLKATTRDAHARLQKRIKDDLDLLADAGADAVLRAPHVEARAIFQINNLAIEVALDANRSLFLREINAHVMPPADALLLKAADKAPKENFYHEAAKKSAALVAAGFVIPTTVPAEKLPSVENNLVDTHELKALSDLDVDDLLDSDEDSSEEQFSGTESLELLSEEQFTSSASIEANEPPAVESSGDSSSISELQSIGLQDDNELELELDIDDVGDVGDDHFSAMETDVNILDIDFNKTGTDHVKQMLDAQLLVSDSVESVSVESVSVESVSVESVSVESVSVESTSVEERLPAPAAKIALPKTETHVDPATRAPKLTELELKMPNLEEEFEDEPTRAQADIAISLEAPFSGAAAYSIPSGQKKSSTDKNSIENKAEKNPFAHLASVVGEGISSGKTGAFALDAEAFALLRGESLVENSASVTDEDEEIRTLLAEAEELETKAKQLRALAAELKNARAVKSKNAQEKPVPEKKRRLAQRLKEQREKRKAQSTEKEAQLQSAHAAKKLNGNSASSNSKDAEKSGKNKRAAKKKAVSRKNQRPYIEIENNGATLMAEVDVSSIDLSDGADVFAETPETHIALIVQDEKARLRLAKKLKKQFSILTPIANATTLLEHPDFAAFTAVVMVRPPKNKSCKEALSALALLDIRPKILVVSPERAWQKHVVVDKRIDLARRAPEVADSIVKALQEMG